MKTVRERLDADAVRLEHRCSQRSQYARLPAGTNVNSVLQRIKKKTPSISRYCMKISRCHAETWNITLLREKQDTALFRQMSRYYRKYRVRDKYVMKTT